MNNIEQSILRSHPNVIGTLVADENGLLISGKKI